MGVDLRLLPFFSEWAGSVHFSHAMLDLDTYYSLWDRIEKIEKKHGMDVPDDFTSFCGRSEHYDDTCYGNTTETPYGNRLKYVPAKYLKPLMKRPEVTKSWKNKAAWAFLQECPDNLGIALFWH